MKTKTNIFFQFYFVAFDSKFFGRLANCMKSCELIAFIKAPNKCNKTKGR